MKSSKLMVLAGVSSIVSVTAFSAFECNQFFYFTAV